MKKKDIDQLPAPHIGVDEVGRGCLAGPVTAAAVIFNSTIDIRKYKDSKQLKPELRTELSLSIHQNHIVAIGWASVEEIDELNILQASFLAMQRAIEILSSNLNIKSGTILVDGNQLIPNMGRFKQRAIIKGDQKLRLISAASIAAKVARDEFMKDLANKKESGLDQYGFEKHKGYGTLYHRKQIQAVGPSKWHRQSFAGVKEYIR
ncbi:MAG: ribonuclease HII [Bdellovibrionota bacterium]